MFEVYTTDGMCLLMYLFFFLFLNNSSDKEYKEWFNVHLLISLCHKKSALYDPRSMGSSRNSKQTSSMRHLSSRAVHLYKGSNILNYLISRLYALALR